RSRATGRRNSSRQRGSEGQPWSSPDGPANVSRTFGRFPALSRPSWPFHAWPHDNSQHLAEWRADERLSMRILSSTEPAMTKVLVLYYSAYGHIEQMAQAVAE